MISELSGDSLKTEHLDDLLELSNKHDAVLIGPGLGTSEGTAETVRQFAKKCTVPTVIDADGLNALGKAFKLNEKMILTPHREEFKRLGGEFDSMNDASSVIKLAKDTGTVVLLKGSTDVISDGERLKRNNAGCVAMTSAGTGDVLAGIIAGLLSKGMTCFDAASLGAFISGKAGEYAFDERSYGMTATDVIESIPKVLKKYLR
jgi:NAD(P)H-hydrate epimerase